MQHKTKHLFLIFLLLFTVIKASAQVGITPRIHILEGTDINKPHAFRLFNFTDKPITVAVDVENWTMDEQNKISLIPSSANSLDQWLLVNPLQFSIPANNSQTIRMAFRPPKEMPNAEYRAMLYFNEVITDDKPDTKQVKSKFRIGAAVYLHVGPKSPQAKITAYGIRQDGPFVEIKNTGNSHIRFAGNWSVWNINPRTQSNSLDLKNGTFSKQPGLIEQGILPTTPVLPGHTRTIYLTTEGIDHPQTTPLYLLLTGHLGEERLFNTFELGVNHQDESAAVADF